jgi:farnesyl-diphosphate farnesyltransferase
VTVAYLLFRIADTFEDATGWSRAERLAALQELGALIETGDVSRARERGAAWLARRPIDHDGYLDLLGQTPAVIAALAVFDPAVRAILSRHALRTAQGMARIVAQGDDRGEVALGTLEELRHYCYLVAGIVGEMLTEVFLHDAPQLAAEAPALHATKVTFGEALQLVNILKDEGDDARGGRRYLPEGRRAEAMALARADVDEAEGYVAALTRAGAPRGMIAFTALLLLLARTSLDRIAAGGPGAKMSRDEVKRVFRHVETSPVGDILDYRV